MIVVNCAANSDKNRSEPKQSDYKNCNIETTTMLNGSEVKFKKMFEISLKIEGETMR